MAMDKGIMARPGGHANADNACRRALARVRERVPLLWPPPDSISATATMAPKAWFQTVR